ncbi:hypothetical protein FKM82_000343 [Ascaphus truei]
MSSDEERSISPIIPKDSDHGSSVSSDLQDEYEELLRYAVVTPKFEPHFLRQHQLTAEQTTSDKFSSPTDDVHQQTSVRKRPSPVEDIHESSQRAFSTNGLVAGTARHSSLATDNQEEQIIPQRRSFLSGMEAFSPLHSEDLSLQGSTSSSSQIQETRVTELPVSTENMNQVEDLLDLWSGNLKVISNLTHAIEKQKEKTELMRTFTHWRLQHTEARQEDYACSLADKHYRKTLVKNVWRAWHSVIESNWKDKVEQACRTRAQEICIELSNDYEAKIAQLNGAVEEARAEVERLHAERGQFEGSMKKAFMRGVCALNMEAMTMFQGRESKMDHADPPHRREELGSSPSVTFQHQAATSGHMSSSQHDIPSPYHTPAVTSEQTFAPHFGPSSASQCKDDISTPVVISATTSGSLVLPTQKLPMTRVVTSSQQKAGKTITARITARTDLAQKISKTSSNITSMGVSPPMSSVVVEKHHPVTQQTISQATAAKYPRSALQSASSISGRSTGQSGRAHHVHTSVHSIKVVD